LLVVSLISDRSIGHPSLCYNMHMYVCMCVHAGSLLLNAALSDARKIASQSRIKCRTSKIDQQKSGVEFPRFQSFPPSLSLSLSLSPSLLFIPLLPPNVSIAPYPRGGNILDPRYARRSRPKEPSDLLRHLNDVLSSLLLQQAGIDFRASAEPGEHSFQAAGCLIAR